MFIDTGMLKFSLKVFKIMKLFYSAISSIVMALALSVAASVSALAHDYKVGDLIIDHPHIPATVKSPPVAAGYLVIKNNGSESDRLVSASATFSAKQQLHTMTMVEGVMRMRPIKDGVEIPAGGEIALKKGGDHLMFMKLSEQMQVGEMREVTLTFERAGEVKIGMMVIDPADMDHEGSEDHLITLGIQTKAKTAIKTGNKHFGCGLA